MPEFLHQGILIPEVKFLVIVFRRGEPGVRQDLCLYLFQPSVLPPPGPLIRWQAVAAFHCEKIPLSYTALMGNRSRDRGCARKYPGASHRRYAPGHSLFVLSLCGNPGCDTRGSSLFPLHSPPASGVLRVCFRTGSQCPRISPRQRLRFRPLRAQPCLRAVSECGEPNSPFQYAWLPSRPFDNRKHPKRKLPLQTTPGERSSMSWMAFTNVSMTHFTAGV